MQRLECSIRRITPHYHFLFVFLENILLGRKGSKMLRYFTRGIFSVFDTKEVAVMDTLDIIDTGAFRANLAMYPML